MDYREAALELLKIRAKLMQIPAQKAMNEFTKGEFGVLDFLYKSNGKAFPKELSRNMNVSSARIAAILKSLEAKGLVVRKEYAEDARQVVAALTENGSRIILEKRKMLIASAVYILERLGEEDAMELLRIQKKILDNA